jgi:hypothetical protein
MIKDHEATVEKLAKFASRPHAKPAGPQAKSAEPGATEVAGTGRIQQRANKPISEHAGGLIDQLQQIEEEAAEECLRLTKEELGKHQGAEFDKAFLGTQIGMHLGMLARLKASEKAVSGEFQALVQDAQKKTMEHKQHLEQVMGQLKSEKPGDAPAAQPRTSAEPRPKKQ